MKKKHRSNRYDTRIRKASAPVWARSLPARAKPVRFHRKAGGKNQ